MKCFHEWCLLSFLLLSSVCPSALVITACETAHPAKHLQNKQNAGHDHISTSKVQRVSVFVPAASHAQLLPHFTSFPLFSSLFSADIWESHWLTCEQTLRLHNVSLPHRLSLCSTQCLPVLPSLSPHSSTAHTTIKPSSQPLLRLRLQHVIGYDA